MIFWVIILLILSSIILMKACKGFDDASSFLGRHFPPGVKGATINAIGSSLPELLTTCFLLFLFHDQDGFAAGVATSSGSALFNAIIIPCACFFAVHIIRNKTIKNNSIGSKKSNTTIIHISSKSILRDGSFLLAAELLFLALLYNQQLFWWGGTALIALYLAYVYFIYLAVQSHQRQDDFEAKHHSTDHESDNFMAALWNLDFHYMLYKSHNYSTASAWMVLSLATIVIAVACYILAESVFVIAHAMDVAPFFVAVFLAAAATSVPDTILSMRDAMDGDYDDAISNAFGSNLFDIAIGIGLPILIYTLLFNPLPLDQNIHALGGLADIIALQWMLFFLTLIVLAMFLYKNQLTFVKTITMLSLYILWGVLLVGRAYDMPVLSPLFQFFAFGF